MAREGRHCYVPGGKDDHPAGREVAARQYLDFTEPIALTGEWYGPVPNPYELT